jgi:hypothetical protein
MSVEMQNNLNEGAWNVNDQSKTNYALELGPEEPVIT